MFDRETQRIYWVFTEAKQRCTNPKHVRYHDYGGRGIKFLFTSFQEFLSCLGPRPIGYELDRKDNDGHYEPSNVRWATPVEQQHNKRKYRSNTSGVKGVSHDPANNRWVARCNESGNGKRRYLYQGKSYEEAVKARKEWENLYSKIKAGDTGLEQVP